MLKEEGNITLKEKYNSVRVKRVRCKQRWFTIWDRTRCEILRDEKMGGNVVKVEKNENNWKSDKTLGKKDKIEEITLTASWRTSKKSTRALLVINIVRSDIGERIWKIKERSLANNFRNPFNRLTMWTSHIIRGKKRQVKSCNYFGWRRFFIGARLHMICR